MGKPGKGYQGISYLKFYQQNQLNILNDGRHIRKSGTSKLQSDLTQATPSLQPILSWTVTDSPLSSDNCVITVTVQSKISEPQTLITKFNIDKANWRLFTSIDARMQVTNPNRSQSAEARTEDFYKKKTKFPQNLLYQ